MSQKARFLLRGIAVILVLLGVFVQLDYLSIPDIGLRSGSDNTFWMAVIAFGLVLFSSR